MEGSIWQALTFYEGESEEALKTRFVELRAKYPNRSLLEITQYIFMDLQEPGRYLQAAERWGKLIDLDERVDQIILKGPLVPESSEGDLVRRALAIADSAYADKDKIAAIRLAGELQGFVKKGVDGGSTPGTNTGVDFLAALAAKLPN
jgi:hypothetical protein